MLEDVERLWSQLTARAWADPAFKAKLLADPVAVLKENGLASPAGVTLKVLENTDKVVYLILPLKPPPEELTEEELNSVAGGVARRTTNRPYKEFPSSHWERRDP